MGFEKIRDEAAVKQGASLTAFAVRVERFEQSDGYKYVVGKTEPGGEPVRVTLASWKSDKAKAYFARLPHDVAKGGVLAFSNATENDRGIFEAAAFRIITRQPADRFEIYQDVPVRIGPANKKDNGSITQTVQRADTHRAERVSSSAAAIDAIRSFLSEDSFDRPGAILRGVDENGAAMSATVVRGWDRQKRQHFTAEQSLEKFKADQNVKVSGLGVTVSGEAFLNYIDRFTDATWQVIPMGSMTLTTKNAAGDKSAPYRFDSEKIATGFVNSFVGVFVRADGGYFVNAVFPGDTAPVPAAYLAAADVAPEFKPAPRVATVVPAAAQDAWVDASPSPAPRSADANVEPSFVPEVSGVPDQADGTMSAAPTPKALAEEAPQDAAVPAAADELAEGDTIEADPFAGDSLVDIDGLAQEASEPEPETPDPAPEAEETAPNIIQFRGSEKIEAEPEVSSEVGRSSAPELEAEDPFADGGTVDINQIADEKNDAGLDQSDLDELDAMSGELTAALK